jgi:hypothetical protein
MSKELIVHGMSRTNRGSIHVLSKINDSAARAISKQSKAISVGTDRRGDMVVAMMPTRHAMMRRTSRTKAVQMSAGRSMWTILTPFAS